MKGVDREIELWVDEHLPEMKKMIVELCRIPSPTGSELRKAEYLRDLLREIPGCADASIDGAGNVTVLYNPSGALDLLLAAAHIDTVFEGMTGIEPEEREGRLYAPSSGDNCTNVAGLFFVLRYFAEKRLSPEKGLLCAFTVGEEGTGNLRGMRHLMETRREGIREVIAVDGTLDSVMNEAVASRRYTVSVTSAGGHSWHDFGAENAIACAAALSAEIYGIEVPLVPRTTFNIGLFHGGRSVNTIADSAEFALDLRSMDSGSLRELEEDVFRLIEKRRTELAGRGVVFTTRLLGERPGGKTSSASPLVRRIESIRSAQGLPVHFHASSTDANIPISLGIPSVTFGIYRGEGAHTRHEYVELDSLGTGLAHLLSVLSAS